MEQTVQRERKIRIIPATKPVSAPGRASGRRQRVAAYCRVSTDSEEQLTSYTAQKAYYTQKINENPDWEMAGIYADRGITGTSMKKRTEFKRMIAACKRGRIDLILTKSLSRFARNTVDSLEVVRMLRANGIGVIFEKENINTLTESSEFLLTLFSGFAQAESESITATYTNTDNASLSVVNENVTIRNTGGGCGLAVNNAQSVQLSGGTYSGTAGAISIVGGSLTLGGLLPQGGDTRYAYFDESGTTPFTGVLGNKSLTGTVTVKKCNHTGEGVCEYTPNEGVETHAMTCLACGYAGAAEDCQYTYTPDSGGEHHITACQFCGRTKTEAHTYGSWTPEHNENAVTIRRSCENCGYTKTDGTFTALAHGQTMQYGKPITLTCSSTLPGATFSWSLNGSTAEGTGASFTLPETLAVGSYSYGVTVKWPGSESNICTKTVIFEVTPAPLTATGATAEGRAYDGTNSVEITGVTLAGILNGDDVSVAITGLTGTLNGSNAGTYTNLTLPAMTLTGADAENYTVTRPAGAVPASVTIRK